MTDVVADVSVVALRCCLVPWLLYLHTCKLLLSTGVGPGPVGPTLSLDVAGPVTAPSVGPTLSSAGKQRNTRRVV